MRPGTHRERGEAHQEPQREPRAEHARAMAPREDHELRDHQAGKQRGKRRIQAEEQRIVAREDRGVAARRREQEQARPQPPRRR